MIKTILLFALASASAFGQSCPSGSTCRPVDISWGASASAGSTGFQGYLVFRAQGSGPAIQITSAPITSLSYADNTAVVGQTYIYSVAAVGIACTPTTPVGNVCGQSAQTAGIAVNIPLQAGIVTAVTLIVP